MSASVIVGVGLGVMVVRVRVIVGVDEGGRKGVVSGTNATLC